MTEHPAWTRTTLEPLIEACHDAQERAFMDAGTLEEMIEKARTHHAAVVARTAKVDVVDISRTQDAISQPDDSAWAPAPN